MGKSSKSKTTNDPSAYSKQYITPAANALSSGYAAAQPGVQAATGLINQNIGGVAQNAFNTSPLLGSAQGYNTDVLNGKYLGQGNPFMQGMIDSSNSDIMNNVNASFSKAGRSAGSDAQYMALAKQLGINENNLRYADYGNERNAMGQAAAGAPALDAAKYAGIAPFLAMAQGTMLPQQSAGALSSGTSGLLGQYNTQTGTQTQSLGSSLAGIAGAGLAGWASGGFKI